MAELTLTLKKEEDGYSIVSDLSLQSQFPFLSPQSTLPPATIPSCAAWFDPASIHQIEIDSMNEFFNGKYPSKTPQVYLTYRNYIIKLYRDKPTSYLSATHCRRVLTGDAPAIIRLHAFLEHWGLINFFAPKPYPESSKDLARPGHISFPKKRLFELGRPYCEFCGNICGVVWFKNMDFSLCSDCYEQGNFPAEMNQENFQKEDLLSHYNYAALGKGVDWDQESFIKLLRALEKHNEDWDAIAEEVGKEKSECIKKYLEIPVRDLMEMENQRQCDYNYPVSQKLIDIQQNIDIEKAIERAKEIKVQEDIQIDNVLNKMIKLQCDKLELKAKLVKDVQDLMKLQSISYRLRLQSLVNSQVALSLSKE